MAALQHLKHKKHEVLLFHVTDHKTEFNFEFEDRPYEFIDAESKERIKLNPSGIKEEFKKQMEAYYHDLYFDGCEFTPLNKIDSNWYKSGTFLINRRLNDG